MVHRLPATSSAPATDRGARVGRSLASLARDSCSWSPVLRDQNLPNDASTVQRALAATEIQQCALHRARTLLALGQTRYRCGARFQTWSSPPGSVLLSRVRTTAPGRLLQ